MLTISILKDVFKELRVYLQNRNGVTDIGTLYKRADWMYSVAGNRRLSKVCGRATTGMAPRSAADLD